MSSKDLVVLLPLLVTAVTALAVLVKISLVRGHGGTACLAGAGILLAAATIPTAYARTPATVEPLLVVDGFALFYAGLFLAATLVVMLLAYGYVETCADEPNRDEFYALLPIATMGALVLASTRHFVGLFLGLETMTIGLYVLIAYRRVRREAVEAGLKYLILAGASSAILLFGIALVYAATGTLAFVDPGSGPVALVGIALILSGAAFKLALVPFHMWTPDVYEGSPAPATAYLATVSKGAVLVALFRYVSALDGTARPGPWLALAGIAVLSMGVGNLLALLQDDVKRVLAYSSIAHLGYVLVAFLAAGELGGEAVGFYLTAYFVTILGAFGVLTMLSPAADEITNLRSYRGLFWRRPALAGLLTACLLSLAGIPLTAGFLAKFYVLAAGIEQGLWLPVLVLVGASAIGLFYYLRIVVVMAGAPERAVEAGIHPAGGIALAALAILLIGFGVYPAALMALIGSMVSL